MYVIADVEWVQNEVNKISPTQLSAIRVNKDWEIVEDFSAYIKPLDSSFYDWEHVAYTGGQPTDFLNAPHCYEVFSSFNKWVGEDTVCWWYKASAGIHSLINGIVLKTKPPKKPIILSEYMPGFLGGQTRTKGNPYRLAKARKIPVPSDQHNSWSDVIAILHLLRSIKFPQPALSFPPTPPSPQPDKPKITGLEYQYDIETQLLHKRGCPLLPEDADVLTFGTLITPMRKKYKACACVAEELRLAKRERVIDEIKRTQYTFIYAENSKIFHRPHCGLLHNADHILGAIKYDTIINKGLRPCKVCKPSPDDQFRPELIDQKIATITEPKLARSGLKRSERAAVTRLEQAQKERASKGKRTDLSAQERADMLILTQPGLAFFAAKGYQNFHTRACSRMEGLSNFIGFDTFLHASRAGFTPCKQCKPTKKQDIIASIPIGNKVRTEETVQDLQTLCDRYGYEHHLHDGIFEVITPVGKWKIHTDTRPVTMEHINLVKTPGCKTYHTQHRIFLSMLDALTYIHKHDSAIMAAERPESIKI